VGEVVPAQCRGRGLAEEEVADAASGKPGQLQDPASDVREPSAVSCIDEAELRESPLR
jgi:hypothetical protein